MKKYCSRCQQEKDISEFYKERQNKDGLAAQCKECSEARRKEWRRTNPEKHDRAYWNQYLKHVYGISLVEYENKLKEQGNRCAICGSYSAQNKNVRRFSVDHDHGSNKIRGLLCLKCNSGLGYFKDNIQILQNAIDYLKRWEGII